MKKSFAAIMLLAAASSAYSQDWGIRAAFDINLPGKLGGRVDGNKLDLYRNGIGGSIGVVYDQWLSNTVFLQPGVSLFYDTYSYKDLIIMEEIGEVEQADPGIYKVGIRVPVMIGYAYDVFESLPVNIHTGPELSYSFAGGYRFKHRSLEVADWQLFGENGEQNRLNLAWNLGMGFDFDFATLGFDVSFGLTDIYKGPMKLRENRISISIARFF